MGSLFGEEKKGDKVYMGNGLTVCAIYLSIFNGFRYFPKLISLTWIFGRQRSQNTLTLT